MPHGDSSASIRAMAALGILPVVFRCAFSSKAYNKGTTSKVSSVAVNSPPMTTVAKGRCTSAPADPDTAMGRKPNMAAVAVRRMGRMRSCVPLMILRLMLFIPSFFNELKRLMSTRPLSTATPKRTMKPTPAEMEKGMPRNSKANTPPTVASGTAM